MDTSRQGGREAARRTETASADPRDTKELILDAAEKLFSRKGFTETTLRTLTAEAGVNLAAVNYHYGTKEALLRAVFARRLDPLNRIRLGSLDGIRARALERGEPPSVEEIMRAFIAPMLMLRDAGEGARAFMALIGRVLAGQDGTTMDIFITYMKPVFVKCYELLCSALPHLSRETVFWRFMFSISAASSIMRRQERTALLAPDLDAYPDSGSILSVLLPFVTAGMETP
jgi:AcrR family transcriptional regulator